jgi:hypothetical protein
LAAAHIAKLERRLATLREGIEHGIDAEDLEPELDRLTVK